MHMQGYIHRGCLYNNIVQLVIVYWKVMLLEICEVYCKLVAVVLGKMRKGINGLAKNSLEFTVFYSSGQ